MNEQLTPAEILKINYYVASLSCSIHNSNPEVDFLETGINFRCCCTEFEAVCEKEVIAEAGKIFLLRQID